MTLDPLAAVPDWIDGPAAGAWLARTLDAVAALPPIAGTDGFVATAGAELGLAAEPGPLGHFPDPRWRRFALAIFAADLACYLTPDDRVTFDRLLYVVDGFPRGFRVWWRRAGEAWLPAGYSAWYPISPGSLARLERGDPTLTERLFPPVRHAPPDAPVYLFNYSLDASSRRSALSRALLASLADDLAAAGVTTLAAVTVSPEGCRAAERFGMVRRATLTGGDLTEWIYVGPRRS